MRSGIFGVIGGEEGNSFGCDAPVTSVEKHIYSDSKNSTFAMHGLWLNPRSYEWHKSDHKDLEPLILDPSEFDSIDGPLQAFYFCKQSKELTLHADFTRQHPVFYYHEGDFFAFAPQIKQLSVLLKQNGIQPSADQEAAASLLSFACIPGDSTLLSGVKKLMPGHSLKFSKNQVTLVDRARLIDISRDLKNIDDAIDLIQSEFSKSTKQMCDTNAHFSATQLNLLSGGIDSRMVFFETKNHTSEINTLCFSVKDYIDHKVSREISADHGATYYFHDLKNGEYMLDASSALQYDGTISYLASSHHREVIEKLKLENLGVIAGGAIGNGVLSEEFYLPNSTKDSILNITTTNQEFRKFCTDLSNKAWDSAPDSGVFKLINRGFLYTNSGSYSTHPKGVLHSPFTSSGFVKASLSLHPDLLHNHKLYLEWMKRHHPEATNYIWERYRSKPRQGFNFKASKLKMKVLAKFIFPITNSKGASMSPVQLWYNESKQIQEFYNSTFDSLKHLLESHLPDLAPTINSSFKTMNITNKASVLTLLIALDKYLD